MRKSLIVLVMVFAFVLVTASFAWTWVRGERKELQTESGTVHVIIDSSLSKHFVLKGLQYISIGRRTVMFEIDKAEMKRHGLDGQGIIRVNCGFEKSLESEIIFPVVSMSNDNSVLYEFQLPPNTFSLNIHRVSLSGEVEYEGELK